MGQVALGIRSLLVKAAVFFVLCALLVWALGGQLFPAPEIVDGASVRFDGRTWFWRLSAGGDEPHAMHWSLMVEGDDKPAAHNDRRWIEQAGLAVVDGSLYYAGLPEDPTDDRYPWVIARVGADGRIETWPLPDRLAAEQQLHRVDHGLPLQDVQTIMDQRPAVLDPVPGSADDESAAGREAEATSPLAGEPDS